MENAHRWDFGFFYWLTAGFLIGFGLVAILSIGAPFLLLGLLLFLVLLWWGPGWPADLGLLAGVGGVCLLIATIYVLDPDPGPSATLWALAGLALALPSTFTFWYLRCRPGVRGSAEPGSGTG
jgi:hypothetical protein